eukprot:COSAG02_NODE_10246_length_1987_cov_2.292373_2_plen_88_part_00
MRTQAARGKGHVGACADEAPGRGVAAILGNTGNTPRRHASPRRHAVLEARPLWPPSCDRKHDHNTQRKTLESFVFSHPPLPFLFQCG